MATKKTASKKTTVKETAPVSQPTVVDVIDEVETETAITTTGAPSAPKSVVETFHPGMGAANKTIQDLTERYQKKIYLIDGSGSMHDGMTPEDVVNAWKWDTTAVEAAVEVEKDALIAYLTLSGISTSKAIEEANTKIPKMVSENFNQFISDVVNSGRIDLVADKLDERGKYLERNYKVQSERKIDIVKGSIQNFCEQRFAKYPDAQVAVWQFEHDVTRLCRAGASKEEVMLAIGKLQASGGTDIYQAVEAAISECERHPSKMRSHHIVLVTDGQDHGAKDVKDLLPRLKTANIVLDFIFVKGECLGADTGYTQIAKVLEEVCKETGGEYLVARKSIDFQTMFLQVSNRPALPPAPTTV
jgi:hypothetical protein